MTSPSPAPAANHKPARTSSTSPRRSVSHKLVGKTVEDTAVPAQDRPSQPLLEDSLATTPNKASPSYVFSPGLFPRTVSASTSASPSPTSSTHLLMATSKEKGKAVDTSLRASLSSAPFDRPPSFSARGKLDPRSTAFTPLRPLEPPAAITHDRRRDSVNNMNDAHGLDGDLFQRSPHSRLSLSSTTSTSIGTPASQLSFTPNTPSSALTWPTSTFNSSFAYTPERVGRSGGVDSLNHKLESAQNHQDFGRFLMVANIPSNCNPEQLRQTIQEVAPFKAIIIKHLRNGWIVVAFYDSRDATKVSDKLSSTRVRFGADEVQLHCAPIVPEAVRQIVSSGEEWDHIWGDSETTVKADVRSLKGVSISGMEKCLATIGELRAFEAHDTAGKSFTADFWDTRHAADAIRVLNNQPVDGGTLSVRYLTEDPFQSSPVGNSRHHTTFPYTLGSAAYASPSAPAPFAGTPFPRSMMGGGLNPMETALPASQNPLAATFERLSVQSPYESRSWNGPSTTNELDHYYQGDVPHLAALGRQLSEPAALQGILNHIDFSARARQQRPTPAPQWPQTADRQAIPPENRVFPERIAAGLDVRTTVMIKDVPNKLSRQELVNILSEVVPGDFDFVYLRFDFTNHCNVGYAFVNFTSCQALLLFIQTRVGKKWNLFSSEKVLQVSYANIQGKAALVNKFRNSAVMDVIEEWRPQIFYSNGTLKGKPEPFPEADNPSMRHRSTSARLSFLSGNTDERPDYDYSGSTPYNF